MSVTRFAPLVLSALCLSACAAGPSGPAVGRYPAAGGGGEAEPPLASLPAAAGRVVAVRRVPYGNGLGQEIVLDGPRAMAGENRITVEALTTAHTGLRGQGLEELKLGPPGDTDVEAEMERALPGVAMHLAPEPERGAEGPIGYAFGTAGRLSCLYAWQYLAAPRPVSLLEGMADTGVLPMSVRVRLCREQPVAALVGTLRGLRVTRPDGAIVPVAVRFPTGGDALDAAMGALPSAASRDAVASPPASAGDGTRPARSRRHRVAARPASLRRAARASRHPASPRAPRGDAVDIAGSPRVPLPGDVAAVAAPPRRAVVQATPRAASDDMDAMPMPR